MGKKSKKSASKSKSGKESAANRSESAEAAVTAEREALARRQLLIATLKAAAPTLAEELGDMNEIQLRERYVDGCGLSCMDLARVELTVGAVRSKGRLRELDDELHEYKELVEECKKENEDLRQEIEDAQRDSAEYTAYLLLKRAEKQAVIDRMQGDHAQSLAEYQRKRTELETKLSKEAQDLTEKIAVLQEKLDSKNQEIVSLSDVLHQRQRHETQLSELKSALEAAQATHTRQVLALERTLLEERVRVQRRNAARVAAMQAAAQHQALTSLAEHTSELSTENERMAAELKEAVARTQAMQRERTRLEEECKRLEREVEVRERVARVRPGAAGKVEDSVAHRVRQAVSANSAKESLLLQQEREKLDANSPARRIRELSGGKVGTGTNPPESGGSVGASSVKSKQGVHEPKGKPPPSSSRSQRRAKPRSLSVSGASVDSHLPARSLAETTPKDKLTSLRNLLHKPPAALPLDIALDPIQFASDQRLLEKVSAKTAALMPGGGRSKSPVLSLPKVRPHGGSAGSSTCSIPGVIDDD
ncbi:hypothetical protein BCR44DRAFT_1497757 [Catenaria anguillulae PL171]|uniref:Uncharacterized protein n=1 Tax=Catenaria anguillulae PL171 TaxID=765915 RepID=A0A1Y2HSZ5_9FUNG|nr:hypothetical protein BCR44DRAFT_1497757 [Catenaria anguillulae PL171]